MSDRCATILFGRLTHIDIPLYYQTLGEKYTQVYTNVLAIIVESALPFGILSFIFVILYGVHNTAQNLFIPILAQVKVRRTPDAPFISITLLIYDHSKSV